MPILHSTSIDPRDQERQVIRTIAAVLALFSVIVPLAFVAAAINPALLRIVPSSLASLIGWTIWILISVWSMLESPRLMGGVAWNSRAFRTLQVAWSILAIVNIGIAALMISGPKSLFR
jgi:hypothetical protein